MKTAIIYFSRHKGNTLKVLRAMTEGHDTELIDVTARMAVDLHTFDRIGFASGIYGGAFHPTLVDYAKQYLPEGKDVFFVYTSASGKGGPGRTLRNALAEKNARLLGSFHCRGLTTFGPFKLLKGFPKGQPDAHALAEARAFYQVFDEDTAQ